MPVFRPDPSKVAAGIQIYDKGEYLVKLGEPKAFLRETKKGKNAGKQNYGVLFVCEIMDGVNKGKKYIHNCMMHTTESEGFSKQFQMAAYGFEKKEEQKFDTKVINEALDFSYDPKPDDGSDPWCGPAWRAMKDKQVYVSLNKSTGDDGEQQNVEGIRPF